MKKMMRLLLVLALSAVCALSLCACFSIEDAGTGTTTPGGSESGDGNQNGAGDNTPGGETEDGTVYKTEGTYAVGTDIEAGEYILVKSGFFGYLQVTTTKDAGPLSPEFLYNETFETRQYVKVNAGEYLNFTGAKLYKLGDEPALVKGADNGYPSGQFKIGRDIPAGDYIVAGPSGGYFEISSVPCANLLELDYNANVASRRYLSAAEGQYVKVDDCKLYAVGEEPALTAESDGGYKAGQYQAGRDLPAGEYVIADPTASGENIYLEQTAAACARPGTSRFLFNENFSNRHYVKLDDGQFVSFGKGKLYPAAQAPAVSPSGGKYLPGQYKIGTDIEAGEYKIEVTAGINVSYLVTTLPLCKVSSEYYVDSGYLSSSKNVTLQGGQYIFLDKGTLVKTA